MTNAGRRPVIIAVAAGIALLSVAGKSEEPKPAPVNPYNGMQEREEVFEFSQKPAVKKEGDKWVITFGSKATCDATVGILDKDGKIVRHLASGVLGKNAPYPFQQNSLSQKLEWDGQDDQGKSAPSGCKVRVGLGLKANRDKSDFNPYALGDKVTFATDPDGKLYLSNGLKYDKDGKYLGRFYPPPSQGLEIAIGSKQIAPFAHGGPVGPIVATQWGDKIPILGWSGWRINGDIFKTLGDVAYAKLKVTKDAPLPAPIAAAKAAAAPPVKASSPRGGYPRMAVNRSTDELYVVGHPAPGGNPWGCSLYRVDGKTLEWDKTFLSGGEFKDISEASVGPNGNIYARIGACGYGQWITCADPSGKLVNLGGDAVDLPLNNKWPDGKEIYMGFWPSKMFHGSKVLWTGLNSHSNIHERGLYVSSRGLIVAQMQSVNEAFATKYGIKDPKEGTVAIWSAEGKLLTANAIGGTFNGHGVAMDRDGNIYSARNGRAPDDPKKLDGLPGVKPDMFLWGGWGTIAKFRAAGEFKYEPQQLWAYPVCSQSWDCTCQQQLRWDLDYWARTWYPARQLCSVMVLDSNGNRMARIGKYGTREEEKKDDIRFTWLTVACASDTAIYVMDYDGRSRLALSYAAEGTILVP